MQPARARSFEHNSSSLTRVYSAESSSLTRPLWSKESGAVLEIKGQTGPAMTCVARYGKIQTINQMFAVSCQVQVHRKKVRACTYANVVLIHKTVDDDGNNDGDEVAIGITFQLFQ